MLASKAAYAARYGGELADHLPMALRALASMGADPARCDAFSTTYIGTKHLRLLGDDDVELRARDNLYGRMLANGWEPVFRAELDELAYGLGAGAFHAFIRAAYAIVAGDVREIAAALVYWRTAALDLGSANAGPGDTTPFDPATALARAGRLLGDVPARLNADHLISDRMAAVAREPAFGRACGRPQIADDFIAQMARATVRAFAAGRSFTLLHAMTATHALRIVAPYANDRVALLQHFWRAYVAAWVSAGAVPLRDCDSFTTDIANAPAWEALLPLACASDDEHVVKAAYTAWNEDAAYGDPLYRVAAARYLKLL